MKKTSLIVLSLLCSMLYTTPLHAEESNSVTVLGEPRTAACLGSHNKTVYVTYSSLDEIPDKYYYNEEIDNCIYGGNLSFKSAVKVSSNKYRAQFTGVLILMH